jgi:2-methylcitrate dehydratase PrpD
MSPANPGRAVGDQLGRFVANSRWDDIAEPVRHEAKRSLLNVMGCALGVARTPPIEMALRVLLPLAGADRVTLIGRPERLDPLGAAFINAVSGNLLDYDDTHLRTVIHPSAPVAPAALALAEQKGLSGQDVLHAFILGAEVECRIGNMVSPAHYARGWHITSTCGVFGSAAAASKLLGLDAAQTWDALGIAASQSAGLVENLPSAAKNVSVGNAARNGVFAALLAQQGYGAAPAAIEGALGWARAMGDAPDVAEATEGLGTRWELLSNTYKPYPCGIVFHSVIDACLALRQSGGVDAAEIERVTVSGSQLLLDRGDRPATNARDARVSIPHCAAVGLLFGAAGLREFSDEVVQDPAVATLRGRISAKLDPSMPIGAATISIETKDRRVLTETVMHAKGSKEHPLSDEEIAAKCRDLAQSGAFPGDIDALIATAWNIEALSDISELTTLLAGV